MPVFMTMFLTFTTCIQSILLFSDCLKDVPTPHREFISGVLKSMDESETPATKRRRIAMGTPKTPDTPGIYVGTMYS